MEDALVAVVLVLCVTCRKEKPKDVCIVCKKENPITGDSERYRCKDCHNLKARVSTILKADPDLTLELDELSQQDRQLFVETGATLYGKNLKVLIQQVVAKTRTLKKLGKFITSGDCVEYDEAEKTYKDKPEEWESIKENATQFVCPVRGIKFVVIPKYQMEEIVEHEDTVSSTTRISRETKRKSTSEPPNPDASGIGEKEENLGEARPMKRLRAKARPDAPERNAHLPEAEITGPQKEILDKIIPAVEDMLYKLTTALIQADEDEHKDHVPKALKTNSEKAKADLEKTLENAREMAKKSSLPKGTLQAFYKSTQENSKMTKDLTTKLRACLERDE